MNPNQRKLLEVGIGRAQVIYLLYAWRGGEILCRGAVMPYYEFTHDRRMNDGEWKALLDSPARPDLPDWVKPIYGSAGAKK
jgi:hypothetical protein